jgi:two-component system OmpR family response regulator
MIPVIQVSLEQGRSQVRLAMVSIWQARGQVQASEAKEHSLVQEKSMRPFLGSTQKEHDVLLVEDDDALASIVARALMKELMKVTVVRSGEEALAKLRSTPPDMLVLDIELPGIDGFEVLSRLRASGKVLPVMVLAAFDNAASRAKSFKLGADAFLGKPIAVGEFTAQMRDLARRLDDANPVRLVYGPLVLDREAGRAFLSGNPLYLAPREWSLLEILLAREGKVLSKKTICSEIAGVGGELSPTAVEVHMSRLRSKLDPADIRVLSVRGLGYMLPKWEPKPAAVEPVLKP